MPRRLDDLPLDVLLEIFDYVPTSTMVSLTLVKKRFNWLFTRKKYLRHLHRTPGGMSLCEAAEVARSHGELRLKRAALRRCRLCRGDFPDDEVWFEGLAPFCRNHEGLFESPEIPEFIDEKTRQRLKAQARSGTCWVALKREFCCHQRRVKGWAKPIEPCCECDHCGHYDVTCIVRISRKDDVPISWERSKDGKWIVECDRSARESPWFVIPECAMLANLWCRQVRRSEAEGSNSAFQGVQVAGVV